MDIEEGSHAFIVRIWREPRELEGARPEWRGFIEHVQSGERRYLWQLDEITRFIHPYLQKLGVLSESAPQISAEPTGRDQD